MPIVALLTTIHAILNPHFRVFLITSQLPTFHSATSLCVCVQREIYGAQSVSNALLALANMTTHDQVTGSPDSTTPPLATEKETIGSHVETVHTNEKVPGHPGYYEKDGLRTYGDDEDHDHEPKVSLQRLRTEAGTWLTGSFQLADVFPEIDELGSHGLFMDRKPNPSLHIRFVF